jgi:RHS repeat-associated protein
VTTDGNTQTRAANAQNQYTSVSGGTTPTYDNSGNLTTDPTNGNRYVYDAWNRLVAVKNGSNTISSYTYDALNRRVTENSSTTQTDLYYNDQWQAIEEQVNGKTQTQYVWDPLTSDTLVERDSNPDSNGNLTLRLYVQQDASGNVTALTDTSGNVVERYVYDPFGVVTVLDANWNTRGSSLYSWNYLFQGLRYEATTGLYYSREREYSPTLGRFLQQDLLPAANPYEYAWNSPTNWTDPLGLDNKWRTVDTVWYLVAIEWETDWTEIPNSRSLKLMGSFPHYECLLYIDYREWIHTRQKLIEKHVQERMDPAALKKLEDQIDTLVKARDAAEKAAGEASDKATAWYAAAGAFATQAATWGFIAAVTGGPGNPGAWIAIGLAAGYGAAAVGAGAIALGYSSSASSYQSQANKARDQIADIERQIRRGDVPKVTQEIPTGDEKLSKWSKWSLTGNKRTIAWRVPLSECLCPWTDPYDITTDINGNKIQPPAGASGSNPVNPPQRVQIGPR